LEFLLCNQIVISRDANSIQYANMMFIAALITMSLTNNKDNTVGMHYSQSDMINFPHSKVTEIKPTNGFGCFVTAYDDGSNAA